MTFVEFPDWTVVPEPGVEIVVTFGEIDSPIDAIRRTLENLYRHARPVTYYPELPDGYPRN